MSPETVLRVLEQRLAAAEERLVQVHARRSSYVRNGGRGARALAGYATERAAARAEVLEAAGALDAVVDLVWRELVTA